MAEADDDRTGGQSAAERLQAEPEPWRRTVGGGHGGLRQDAVATAFQNLERLQGVVEPIEIEANQVDEESAGLREEARAVFHRRHLQARGRDQTQ
jgi:hypothetical protein